MSLHIIVCIKSVVRSAPNGVARRTLDNSELNPFDRPALEAALQLKTDRGATVTVLTMGPGTSAAALAEAQAMGTDRAVLINDRALAESDTLVTSRVLAAAIQKLEPVDLVLFGVRASDSDTGQVGPQTATLLKMPFISGVQKMDPGKGTWDIRRSMDDWHEEWQLTLPAAMTIDPRAFAPRPIGLIGIATVYDQPSIESWTLTDLGLFPESVGLQGSPTRVANLHKIKRKRTCEMLAGEPREQVALLMERLSKNGVIEL
jgi:electron transfer flavoprotein beta subunit